MRRHLQGHGRRLLIPQRGDHLWRRNLQQRGRDIGRYLRRSRELSHLFDDGVRAFRLWRTIVPEGVHRISRLHHW
jgi:hypothetical protein